jgi:hypothetical protein
MTPTTPREALIGAITNYCTHTGKPTECDVGCGDCAEIVDDCRTALAPFMQEWRTDEPPKNGRYIIVWDAVHGGTVRVSFSDDEWVSEFQQWSGRFKHWMPDIKPPQVTP